MPAQHPTTARIIRTTDLTPERWANGGGWTREIHREPSAAPDHLPAWRLSLADIDEPGPFSSLPGMDRYFLLAAPRSAPLELVVDGVLHIVHFPRSITFAGDAEVSTAVVPPGTRALNLMVRSGTPGSLQLLRGDTELTITSQTAYALVLLDGDAHLDGGKLARFDAILPGRTGARLTLRHATMAYFPSA
ncbi:HutD/Ves family protein [Streptomyces cavernicola]|uniref:HutD family protein n=1 Tax=Streptomyces cavernicola TaxID=3043613 RepID=A0ABT6SE28_9ACTN|nr:HutD family protein [Streptomyces sp. B-S-A6]MDI3406438.1 HutD family protein [Streptomyces sp. B-S-A6]